MVVRVNTIGALILASMTLLGVSVIEAFSEISPYFVSGYSAERRFLAITSDEYRPGRSLWSKEMFLRDCQDVAKTVYAKAQPTTKRTAFLQRCDDEAATISRAMPAYARAWLVQAAVAAELGRPGFLNALRNATSTAPNAHWAAERRTGLAEGYFDQLESGDVLAYERDLRTLLDSEAGTLLLARRFASTPELRARLSKVVASAPTELQARFVEQVKREAEAVTR